MNKNPNLTAIDFFCSAGGITNGFNKAGINVIAGIDIDKDCEQTYTLNNSNSAFINFNIKDLPLTYLQENFGINRNDDNLVFIGCSPCQYFSKIKTDKTKSLKSKNLLNDFKLFIDFYLPGYVVMENVPGIMSSKYDSPLKSFLAFLISHNYSTEYKVIDSSHYGIPQTRKRFLLISTRLKKKVQLPAPITKENPPTVKDFISDKGIYKMISDGHEDNSNFIHTTAKLSVKNLNRVMQTPKDGGTRMSYFTDEKIAIPSHLNSKNFSDSYGRMYWDRPAPTITTRFNSISNGRFIHPEENRGLSLREGATLQTFDMDYLFKGPSKTSIAKQIGNAVPPKLAQLIAETVLKIHNDG
ncbi:MAG: DNA cytosine methyltransferase [Saprospiraceae bacterium]|nr:DNA cytosine methyltransferase [Saprospiraceae bacterium]